MRIGVLFNSARCASLHIAITMARGEFTGATHTRGHVPQEIHFNPAECPVEESLAGMAVFANEQVPAGHIRITTDDLSLREELEADMRAVDEIIGEIRRGIGPAQAAA